ncbi:hypothetical protein Q4S25_02660, partial [Morganella morganii]
NNEEAMLPQKELAERINRISTEFGYQPDKNDDSPISNLKKHGDWLRETYNIRQFILFGNSKLISELRDNR